MNRLLPPLLVLLALPAWASPDDDTVIVLDTATNVTAGLTGGPYKSFLIENGGAAAIYCSRNSSVTVDDGHKVGANDGFRAFPNDGPIYCIAASSQSGTGRAHAIVWGSYQ